MRRLTVGVPAYNNAATLRANVEGLLAQDFGDFELLISDDVSTDATREVGEALARQDGRVRYVRQPRNLRYDNFLYLLREARTELFMWAAADDHHDPRFVAACVDALDVTPQAVLAVSRVGFTEEGRSAGTSDGTFALTGSPAHNVRRFLLAPGDNSRMYGVMRREPAQRCFPQPACHAYDWAFSAATLRFGWHLEIPQVLMSRDRTPWRNYAAAAEVDARTPGERWFPLLAMTRWLLRDARMPRETDILRALLALNLDKHFEIAELRMPRYARVVAPLARLWKQRLRRRLRGADA